MLVKNERHGGKQHGFWATAVLLTVLYSFVGLSLYVGGLNGPMYYDSEGWLAGNAAAFAKSSPKAVIDIFPQRSLAMITFYGNYLASGMGPASFRVVNVILLATLAALVAVLLRLIFEIPCLGYTAACSEKTVVAALLGLLFLVHPLNVFSTLYIWQRMNLLAAVFSCATMAAYLSVRLDRFRSKSLGYALCVVFFACGLLSKENAVVVPALLLVCELALLKSPWKQLAVRTGIFLAIGLPLLWSLSYLQHPHGRTDLGTGLLATVGQYYAEAGMTLAEVLLTQSRVITSYVSTIVYPSASEVWLFRPLVISRSVFHPPETAAAVVIVLGLAGCAVWLLNKRPAGGFGILVFLLGLAPEAVLVPQFPYLGYRCLFPMIGLWICAADGTMALLTAAGEGRTRTAVRFGVAALLICLSFLAAVVTTGKVALWRDPVWFWEEHVANIPTSGDLDRFSTSKALNNLAHSQLQYGRNPADALAHLRRAAELSPHSWVIRHNMGTAYKRMQNYREAVKWYRKALDMNPGSTKTRKALEEAARLSHSDGVK